jgi:mono/diheme cytochrome c family protein
MVLNRSSRASWMPWIISCALLAAIGGCSATRDSSTAPGPDPGYTTPADPAGRTGPSPAAVSRGQQLFQTTGCTACHAINGQGGNVGPDLSNEANKGHSRQWLTTQIRDPKANDPQTAMPSYDTLPDADISDLVDYLLSLSAAHSQATIDDRTAAGSKLPGPRASSSTSSNVAEGGRMWAQTCGQCHNFRSPSQYSDAQWQVAVHHMRVRVPLTGEQQRKILEFLQATN